MCLSRKRSESACGTGRNLFGNTLCSSPDGPFPVLRLCALPEPGVGLRIHDGNELSVS